MIHIPQEQQIYKDIKGQYQEDLLPQSTLCFRNVTIHLANAGKYVLEMSKALLSRDRD